MTTEAVPPFGVLLKCHRAAAGLTQQQLAEQAHLSVDAVSALERGLNQRPHDDTVALLAAALSLTADQRVAFLGAARPPARRAPRPAEPVPATAVSTAAPALPPGNFLGAAPAGPLVAREDELARVHAVLDAVAGGSGQVLLVSGEAGVGKTRLAQEAMRAAQGQGFVVGSGRCYAREQGTPYAALLAALSGVVAGAPRAVRTEAQHRQQELAHLLPPQASGSGTHGDYLARQRCFDGVAGLLLLVAARAPVAVLLDDLHWADEGTVQLLHHLAQATHGARVLLGATVREARLHGERPVLAQTLRDLGRERLLERLSLRRLVPEETTLLVAALMGQPGVSEEFAAFVQRRTRGNPRLVAQLVRALGGRLQLRREIGAGATGRVFEALDSASGQVVAAKLLLSRGEIDLEDLLRVQREGAMLAALAHPNIVRLHDLFVEAHAGCIIMELLDGPTLGQILRAGPLPLPRAKKLALQVAAALAHAHGQGIAHRDIKPDNILVVGEDQVKVTDFGIARILRPDTSLQTIASTGTRLGTPLYMAPEQIAGKRVDGRTDLYALGAVLYHMVTGHPPFDEGDALAVAVQHLQEEPPRPSVVNPAVPAAWEALILKALAKDPARRYQSAEELERAIGALGVEARPPSHSSHRRRWMVAVTGLLLVLATTMATVWAHASPPWWASIPLFDRILASPSTTRPPVPPALYGTYERTFDGADLRAAHDASLARWVGALLTITVTNGWIRVSLPDGLAIDEYVLATPDGSLTLLGYLPTNSTEGFCSSDPHRAPPTGYYRWSLKQSVLIITPVKDDHCLDRSGIVPGRWMKI